MAYVLCLIYITIIYIRPGEMNYAWVRYHIAETTGVAAAAAAVFSLFFRPRSFANLPQDWCFLGFCLVALVANATTMTSEHFSKNVELLLPLLGFYFLIRISVQHVNQLRGLIVVLCLLTVFQAVSAIVNNSTVPATLATLNSEDASHTPEDGVDQRESRRIQGTGIYGDPNDLAISLLVVLPFLLTAGLSPAAGLAVRMGGLTTVGIIGYALFLTQSRGGFLGVAALSGSYAYRRFGKVSAVIVLLAVFAAGVAAGPSRLQRLDSNEGSAQGRVLAWSAGLRMLKSHPLLGVGFNRFAEFHERVAHNSFIDTFAELGVVGGFFLVGAFYWHLAGNSRARDVAGAASSTIARDVWASAIGVVVSACFLSRQNVPVLYVPIALGAARIAVQKQPDDVRPFQREWDWILVGATAVGVVAATYVAVRLMAVYG